MDKLTDTQKAVLRKVLLDKTFQNLIGAEEWSLTEEEEIELWALINQARKEDKDG